MFNFFQFTDNASLESALNALAGFALVYGIAFSSIGLVLYILKAIGVYKMGKTAGANHPWIAFIPLINCFALGRVAEKYIKRDGSRSAKFSVILLVLRIGSVVLTALFVGSLISAIVALIADAGNAVTLDETLTMDSFQVFVPAVFLYLLTFATALTYSIVYYVALWRVYNAFDCSNGTLFLVLAIIFNFLEGIFLFALRNKQPVFDYRERFGSFDPVAQNANR